MRGEKGEGRKAGRRKREGEKAITGEKRRGKSERRQKVRMEGGDEEGEYKRENAREGKKRSQRLEGEGAPSRAGMAN